MAALTRRNFARFLALSGSAALFPDRLLSQPEVELEEIGLSSAPLPPAPAEPDERYWKEVRSRFLLPADLGFLNAANLCPTSLAVVEALDRNTRLYDGNPSPTTRSKLMEGREEARRLLAAAFRVTPEEIVITRNTSEGNNIVSSGLQLGSGDEVLTLSDNHPSNLAAWREKAKRFGFTVITLEQPKPHPGPEYYLDAVRKAITPRTKVLAFTHVTNSVGDAFPAAELCSLAREQGVLSLLDGAQSCGILAIDISTVRPDFYTGSAHKFLCGPKETGVLYLNRAVHERIWPSIVSLYPGAVGISRTFESTGQRDEAAMSALGDAVSFQLAIGRAAIEARGRELAQAFMRDLSALPGVTVYTSTDPRRSASVVTFKPAALDPRKLGAALYERDRIAVTARAGTDRPGVRLSPHIYNTLADVERTVSAIRRYVASGL